MTIPHVKYLRIRHEGVEVGFVSWVWAHIVMNLTLERKWGVDRK